MEGMSSENMRTTLRELAGFVLMYLKGLFSSKRGSSSISEPIMKLTKVCDEMLASSLMEGERIMVAIRGSLGHALVATDTRVLLLKPSDGRKVVSHEFEDILSIVPGKIRHVGGCFLRIISDSCFETIKTANAVAYKPKIGVVENYFYYSTHGFLYETHRNRQIREDGFELIRNEVSRRRKGRAYLAEEDIQKRMKKLLVLLDEDLIPKEQFQEQKMNSA